jgi:hypothetical protein
MSKLSISWFNEINNNKKKEEISWDDNCLLFLVSRPAELNFPSHISGPQLPVDITSINTRIYYKKYLARFCTVSAPKIGLLVSKKPVNKLGFRSLAQTYQKV